MNESIIYDLAQNWFCALLRYKIKNSVDQIVFSTHDTLHWKKIENLISVVFFPLLKNATELYICTAPAGSDGPFIIAYFHPDIVIHDVVCSIPDAVKINIRETKHWGWIEICRSTNTALG